MRLDVAVVGATKKPMGVHEALRLVYGLGGHWGIARRQKQYK
jgi:hypothetical protein